jgi:hypothetical protein
MVALQDIKADLPGWPDQVVEQWLLTLASQPDLGWPPPDPLEGHRWEHIITNPVSWWQNVTWALEARDCSFNKLSVATRIIVNKMYQALIDGVDNGYGGDNCPERFARAGEPSKISMDRNVRTRRLSRGGGSAIW